MQHYIPIARFGRVRDRMVSLADIVALHPLKETVGTRAKSLIFDRNHGAWEGTGTTRGVSLDVVPEGELVATFNGSGRVRVPNDGEGFSMEGDGAARTLSLANGHANLFGFIKTTHSSATLRCLVHKQDGGVSTANGIRVAYQSGQLIVFMKRAGSVIVNFARDLPMDGRWHIFHAHMSGLDNLARLTLDGFLMGAEETCSAEPPLTSGDYCIGGFSDLSGGFIGSLGLIGCSRAQNREIGAELTACLTWSPITPDIRVETEPVEARHGLDDGSPTARTAPPGEMTLTIDNSPLNEAGLQGRYTPGHVNVLSGWKKGIPIKWVVTGDDGVERTRFYGRVTKIAPEPGLARQQRCRVECETWLSHAMRTRIKQLPIRTQISSGDAIRYLIDQCDRPPRAISIDPGDATFPVVFDDVTPGMTVYEVMARVNKNEGGQLYEQPDGTLVFEQRSRRYLPTAPVAFWDDTNLEELEADSGEEEIANVIPYALTQRVVGATATENLAAMEGRLFLAPGATQQIELSYRDPDNPSVALGGADVTVPAATTDYTATVSENGTGGDLTAFAVVSAAAEDIGGSSIKLTLENTGSLGLWLQVHQVRGRRFQKTGDITREVRDDASVLEHDVLDDPMTFEYLTDQVQAAALAGQQLALRSQPFMAPRVAHRRGVDEAMQTDILDRVLGDMVAISEPMSALDGTERTFIQGIDFSIGADGVLKADYTVSRAQASQSFWILGEPGYSELGETTVLA